MRFRKSIAKRKLYSNKLLHLEKRNTSNKQAFISRNKNKNKLSSNFRRKEIIKNRAEINKIGTRKNRKVKEKINKIDESLSRLANKKKGLKSNYKYQ